MGNQGMGGPGGGRNPFGQMSEEEKKKARERRQEECKWSISNLIDNRSQCVLWKPLIAKQNLKI